LNVDYQWNFERSNGESDDEGLDDPASLNRSTARPASTSISTTRATPSLNTMTSMDPPSTDANFLDRSTADSITSSPMKTSSPSRPKSQRTSSSSSNKILQNVPQFTTKNEDVMDQLRQRLKDPHQNIPKNIALVPDRHTPDRHTPNRPVARTRGTQSTKETRVKLRVTGSNSFRDNRKSQGDSLNRSANYRNSAELSNPTPKARTIIPSIRKSSSPSSTLLKRDSHDYAEVGILESTKTSPSSRSNTFQSSPSNSLKDEYKRKSRSLESTLRSVDSSNNSSVSRNSSFSSKTSRQKPSSEPEQASLPEPVNRVPSRVRAIYDCDADDDDELTFVVGEYITITGEEEEGWLHGHIESQPHRSGLLPQIFVEILEYRS